MEKLAFIGLGVMGLLSLTMFIAFFAVVVVTPETGHKKSFTRAETLDFRPNC